LKRYLVTGGAGFIGSHLVSTLLEQGAFVRVLDNFSTGKKENLIGVDAEIVEGDLRSESLLAEVTKDIDIIFHEAAFVSVPHSMQSPMDCFDVNQRGTETLLEAARKSGVKRVVLASSAAVYGDSEDLPIREDSDLHPLSPYAVSKRVTELYAEMYTRSFGLDVVALRYFNIFGPRQRPDSMYAAVVPIFIRKLLDGQPVTVHGNGCQTRDLVFVDDVIRANLLASEHPKAPGQVFNICTGQETRVIDLLEVLLDMFPSASKPVFDDPRPGDIDRSFGSPRKAEEILGFKPKTSLQDGLASVVEWMKSA